MIWVVVKIMAPFWLPNIVRHLIFRVPIREFPKIRGTLFRGPYNKDPTI